MGPPSRPGSKPVGQWQLDLAHRLQLRGQPPSGSSRFNPCGPPSSVTLTMPIRRRRKVVGPKSDISLTGRSARPRAAKSVAYHRIRSNGWTILIASSTLHASRSIPFRRNCQWIRFPGVTCSRSARPGRSGRIRRARGAFRQSGPAARRDDQCDQSEGADRPWTAKSWPCWKRTLVPQSAGDRCQRDAAVLGLVQSWPKADSEWRVGPADYPGRIPNLEDDCGCQHAPRPGRRS